MKYKSELIKEIVETRGHEKSSLHYESECVESWIEETKGAYPKLCDYQSEWLNYIIENPIGVFPYEIITDVTEATVNNVVPYAYKRATLKGQTVVNLCQFKATNTATSHTTYEYNDNKYIVTNDGNDGYVKTDITVFLGANKTYTFKAKCDRGFNNSNGYIHLLLNNATSGAKKMDNGNTTFTVTSSGIYYIRLDVRASNEPYIFSDLMIIEGDYTKQDIPYFTGMQSVKIPVLTTTGKNFMNSEMEIGILNSNDGSLQGSSGWQRSTNFIALKSNTQFQLNDTVLGKWFLFYDKDRNFISSIFARNGQFITPQNCVFVKFAVETNDLSCKWQIELGTTISEYEPYKTNILTVNEDVTLRSNGDICDELNLLTGQLTQRIDEDGEVLSQEVVKAVDLSIQDQDGNTLRKIKPIEGTMHINSDGTPLKPSITMEIPVEATTQNLSSFIKEE